MKHSRILLPALSLVAWITGCSNRVIFTTQTSLGLDVSGTAQIPNKVSFSHNRYEAAIVPRKANGEAHSIYGGLDADINFFEGSTIKQTFATGEAAILAPGPGVAKAALLTSRNPSRDPLLFFTGTTFGLHLTAGETEIAPTMLMGYRRTEATVIPVPDSAQEVRPVYADILINTKKKPDNNGGDGGADLISTNFPAVPGVRIKQSFATGTAAVNLARDSGVQEKLSKAAGTAANTLARLREKSAGLQKEVTLEVSRLSEAQLVKGGEALVASGLVKEAAMPSFSAANAFEKARLLRKLAEGLSSESEIKKLEKYLVLLRDIK